MMQYYLNMGLVKSNCEGALSQSLSIDFPLRNLNSLSSEKPDNIKIKNDYHSMLVLIKRLNLPMESKSGLFKAF